MVHPHSGLASYCCSADDLVTGPCRAQAAHLSNSQKARCSRCWKVALQTKTSRRPNASTGTPRPAPSASNNSATSPSEAVCRPSRHVSPHRQLAARHQGAAALHCKWQSCT